MSTSPNTRARAEQARRDYFKDKTAQLPNEQDLLKKPDIEGIVDPADGTLHKDLLQSDLQLLIPQWENLPGPGLDYETLQLKYSLTGLPNSFQKVGTPEQFDPPILPEIFPITLLFPKDRVPRDGKLWIAYDHENYKGDMSGSEPIELTCDAVPPLDQAQPRFAEVPGVINEAYLAAHPAGIELTLEDYPDRKPGDTCDLYYQIDLPPESDLPAPPVSSVELDDSLRVTVPVEAVRRQDDGSFFITFFLYDKARNRSRMAFPVKVDVVLGDEPAGLQPPQVPLADDGLVDLKDAQAGVTVRIPAYNNRKNTDRVVVTWGTTDLDPEQLGSRPFPIEVWVFNQILNKEYGAATGPVTTPVSYRIMRGNVPYGPADTTVEVDFSVAGPERPDPDPTWPDPVNPNLAAPQITSATNLSNELAPADRGQPATLTFSLYDRAVNGQVVDFYWDATLVHTYTVATADAPSVDIEIPWAVIVAAGNNPQLPVHYTVRADTDAVNEQESPRQRVNVHAISMTPDDMEFLDLTDRGWLSCSSLWDPDDLAAPPTFRARVPSIARFNVREGTQVTLNWYVTKDQAQQEPIDVVKNSETFPLTQAQIDDGFTWRIGTYEDHILPIYAESPQIAFAHVWYVVDPGGANLISNAIQNRVSISAPSENLTCDLTQP